MRAGRARERACAQQASLRVRVRPRVGARRVRAGTILDENPSNTGSDSYPAAGSAMGIAVNGGNPLKVANVGYGGWTEPNIIAADATWSLWVAF